MKYFKLFILLSLSMALFSCEDDQKQQVAEAKKMSVQNDSIVKALAKNWKFTIPEPTAKVRQQMGVWNEWEQLKNELTQKPSGDLSSFRQKTKDLVRKTEQAQSTIPAYFNKPQVRSRFGVLITKIKSLHTFVGVDPVPTKKVFDLIGGVNYETASIFSQFDEIIRKSEIPKEIGEEEMLRALDTVRHANPEAQPQPPASTQPQKTRLLPKRFNKRQIQQKN